MLLVEFTIFVGGGGGGGCRFLSRLHILRLLCKRRKEGDVLFNVTYFYDFHL